MVECEPAGMDNRRTQSRQLWPRNGRVRERRKRKEGRKEGRKEERKERKKEGKKERVGVCLSTEQDKTRQDKTRAKRTGCKKKKREGQVKETGESKQLEEDKKQGKTKRKGKQPSKQGQGNKTRRRRDPSLSSLLSLHTDTVGRIEGGCPGHPVHRPLAAPSSVRSSREC